MSVRMKMERPFEWKVWHLYLMAAVASLAIVAVLAASLIGALYLRGLSKQETERNARLNAAQQRSISNLKRIQALEKPPTQQQLAAAALDALLACSNDPKCRAAFRNTVRRSRIRPSDVPALRRRLTPDPATNGSTGGSSAPTPSTTPSPRRPSSPSPGNRTPAPRRPATPTPAPSRPPASTPAPSPAPAQPPAQPTPSNPLPVPVPPVPPVTPPVPVPGLPPVCVPPVGGINCPRDAQGRINNANPDSNSGSGNTDDPDCERYGFPCPPGLVRLPGG